MKAKSTSIRASDHKEDCGVLSHSHGIEVSKDESHVESSRRKWYKVIKGVWFLRLETKLSDRGLAEIIS